MQKIAGGVSFPLYNKSVIQFVEYSIIFANFAVSFEVKLKEHEKWIGIEFN